MKNFGNYILRDTVMADILKEDKSDILYWAGKRLFLKYKESITTFEDLINFFDAANLGHLDLVKSTKKQQEFKLSGEYVSQRINESLEFSLESGFLCEYVQNTSKMYSTSEVKIKSKDLLIIVDIGNITIN